MVIGYLGLGLIGGSIAKTVRRLHPKIRQIAYNRHEEVTARAIDEGIIDRSVSPAELGRCDIVFLCVPVITTIDFLRQLKPQLRPDTLLTDVGSVKGEIHKAVEKLGLSRQFIGGHPMAGSEKTGYEHSTDHLIENAWYILTPGQGIPEERVEAFSRFITSIHALPIRMSCEDHDYATAAISHVPHVASAALVNTVRELDDSREYMRTIAAGGFKDITRISSSSPQMWQEICLANGEMMEKVLNHYIDYLCGFRDAIMAKDEKKLLDYFSECKEYRDSF